MTASIAFSLKFALISYAAVAFFVIGLGLALTRKTLDFLKLILIFSVVALFLSLSFTQELLLERLIISAVWTCVIGTGYRFGKKVQHR